ncbi:AAA family ATPase [Pseudarthrobacter sp. B907]|uniref:AAA family ATPase n=1 Tax=Pseudarthrobacter sp. B907 TaxID=3158261 RepID=UPI0032DA511C
MLQRIDNINGIGLFNEAFGSPHTLKRVALIFGDNGRGKSTLSSVLRSVSSNDASIILERKTVDGNKDPYVKLRFDAGHQVRFEDGAWTSQRSEIVVFDTDFIERNVYSGGEVTTEHRKNLLSFALGDKAVNAKTRLEKATTDEASIADALSTKKRELAGHHGEMPLSIFETLPPLSEIDNLIARMDKRLVSARDAGKLLQRSLPGQIEVLDLPVDNWFEKLQISLDDLHEQAESVINQHLGSLSHSGAEVWLAEGQKFDDGISCPYCGQATHSLDIIGAYRSHFNTAYIELKSTLELLERVVDEATSSDVVRKIASDAETANRLIESWSDVIELPRVSLPLESVAAAVANVREPLLRMIAMKRADLADSVGTESDLQDLEKSALYLVDLINAQNDVLIANEQAIVKYKSELMTEDVTQLLTERNKLRLTMSRYSSVVIDLFVDLKKISDQLKTAELAKKYARQQLTDVMRATLSQYRTDINKNLRSLGASFEIDEFQTNFRGLEPRTDYGINLRGKSVKLAGGSPSFSTALSEGDKRTLAFAFFASMIAADPDIAKKVIVVDDPVSSLDRSRRNNTQKILTGISDACNQLIVLGHDANFIRDLRNVFEKHLKSGSDISIHQISRSQNRYSSFDSIDIDKECESPYHRNYRLVYEFVNGSQGNARDSAIAIRPLLEGYLHRRFPGGLLPARATLGAVLLHIKDQVAPSPLVHIHHLLPELNEINNYASRFHHDTASDCDAEVADAQEVEAYGTRTLKVIYGANI